jgi:hypothetical protein
MADHTYEVFINDNVMTSTSTIYSERISMKMGSLFSLHCIWTGTPTGTLTLWQSNLPDPDPDSVTDWIQNTDVTFTDPAGSASSTFVNAGNAAAKFYMVRYVNSSGSGVLSCWANVGAA